MKKKKKKASKVSKKKAKKKAAKKAKKVKKKVRAKKVSRPKAKKKTKKTKAITSKKKVKTAPSKKAKLSLAPKAAPEPKAVTYSQESSRPLPGGFETRRTQITESPDQVEVDQEEFSYQDTSNLDEEASEEQGNLPEEEEGLIDDLGEDDDLPPHLR